MRTRPASPWRPLIAAIVLLLIAAGLVQQWPDRGLWYDETVNAYFAEQGWGEVWEWCTRIDNQMPLDFVLRMVWGRGAGTSEFALRAYSLGFALLSVAGVIALGRRVSGRAAAGWIAGLAFALTQSFLYAAFEVRPYALALALYAWSGVVLWELWICYAGSPRPLNRRYGRLLAAYCVLALSLLYTHYTGFFALAAHGVFVGVDTLRHWTRRRLLVLVHLGAGLFAGYVPWLAALAGRDVRAGTAYEAQVKPLEAFQTYLEFYTHGQRIVTDATPPYAGVLLVLLVATGAIWFLATRRRAVNVRGFAFVLAGVIVPLSGLLLMVYSVQAKLSGRHGWLVWIALALLLGGGLAALDRLKGWRVVLTLAVLALVWLPAQADLHPTYNSYLREAFAYINAHAQDGDVLVLRDGTLFTAAEYYDVAIPWIGLPPEKLTDVRHFLFVDRALDDLDTLIQTHEARRVWVFAWQGQIMDPQDLVNGVLEFIGDPQPLPGAFGFGDVSVTLYALRDDPAALRTYLDTRAPEVETPNGGPVYYGGRVLNAGPVPHGGFVLIHTWWQRGTVVMPEMRVSVRLYDRAGNFYAQIDQPPVSPSFGQENWPPDTLVLSRFLLWVPPEMPDGPAEVRFLIYHMRNRFDPISVPVGEIEVHD